MKYIKRYENFTSDDSFVNDENRAVTAEEPEYNASNNLKAKNYVELIFNKGGGAEVNALCKEIGCKMPKDDEGLEKTMQIAIKYFIQNPERIKNTDQQVSKYPYQGSDGVVRTNNIGGTSYTNSTHVGESVKNSDDEDIIKLDISDDEMRLFGTETQLIKLIKNNKISLYDNQVWFDKNDDETKRVLDIFLEI
jgi:hypothetical protein